ncbi:hypothetical protein [Effusibacillus lacus]|uniref:Uncharacterized protein n=1 Tax=Effusibacillus lacus TaxID=1348429 RepID=A0A292YMJ8_9BACL|nr:hypothetical protein [Effusibacillus lacus]TCS75261.1 hypothetical protein EDD64_10811 [Effusibacillus lacus]GAX89700.1 hypothetical protein EFBL_1324 [Effusibacillus lacus]
MEYRRPQSYEERFLAVSTSLERLLFRIAILGFAGILVSQMILVVPELRQVFSSVDRMEGQKISQEHTNIGTPHMSPKEIIIRPVGDEPLPAEAWVRINGTPVARISQSQAVIKVRHMDKVEIQTMFQRGIYRFEIDHNDPSIISPTPGTIVEASGDHAAVIDQILIDRNSLAR